MEYERRSKTDRSRRDDVLVDLALKAAVVGIVIGAIAASAHVDGVVVGAVFGLLYFLGRVGPKASTVAWKTGSGGEVLTAQELDPLAELGYVVMHDLRISMSTANIDHLVIGPSGVFVVETKNIRGRVRLDGREVWIGGRRIPVVDEVMREVAGVRNVLEPLLEDFDVSINAIVCGHRADLPWFHRSVAGISFVYPGHLRREITKRQEVLSALQVAELRSRAERLLPPRRQRSDVA